MLNMMQEQSEFEKLDFLFWKARDKKFITQGRETKDKTDVSVGTRITFEAGTLQTGRVKWSNSVPEYRNDTVPGIEDEHPEPDSPDTGTPQDPWKRFAHVTVVIDGTRYQFNAEGVTSVGVLANLFKGVMDLEGLTTEQVLANKTGLASVSNFEVTYDGITEFDSRAGSLGKPVWADLELIVTKPVTSEKTVDNNLDEDSIPF